MSEKDTKIVRNGFIVGILVQMLVGIIVVISTNTLSSTELKSDVATLKEQSEHYANKSEMNTIHGLLIKTDAENKEECRELEKKVDRHYEDLTKSIDNNFKELNRKIDNIN